MQFDYNTPINIDLIKKGYFLRYRFLKITLGLLLLSTISCKKFIEIPPPTTKLVDNTIFTSDATATAAMVGIYSRMMERSDGFVANIALLAGLSADEFNYYSNNVHQQQFYENALVANNNFTVRIWTDLYQYIYSANAVLEGLANSQGVSSQVKQQLNGEAKFIRGFCYFYLVNLYGDIPLILTTDYKVNAVASRTATTAVYQQIVTDLVDAKNLLTDDYSYSNGERIRPNKGAATAMLARVYLYTGDWADAELQATTVIDKVSLYSLVNNLNSVFLKNSGESIWQLQPVAVGYNTFEGDVFVLTSGPNATHPVALRDEVVSDFETGDTRKTNWVGINTVGTTTYKFSYKYKIKSSAVTITPNEYLMVLRLAEQYLIRAEARAQLNNITGAQDDINAIRERAGGGPYPTPGTLPNTTANDQASLLVAIEHERRMELFAEWGHRWLDLKRWGRADAVLSPIKTNWQSSDALYPLPKNEILNDPHLTQNPGYN